jgi:hypothetical protein
LRQKHGRKSEESKKRKKGRIVERKEGRKEVLESLLDR